ncbi:hypothetical protein ABFV80_000367 [Vandammella animalimorsus]|uniref:hypothetical protein n=1 Tax=Vandammella animalimorsus TaxID=2029117 RepID=UPI00325C3002
MRRDFEQVPKKFEIFFAARVRFFRLARHGRCAACLPHVFSTFFDRENPMSQLKNIAALAASLIAASTFATAQAAEQKCGAGTCGKKESSAPAKDAACAKKEEGKEAACSKKEAACSKKEGKEAACSKKDAACSKKEAACSKK